MKLSKVRFCSTCGWRRAGARQQTTSICCLKMHQRSHNDNNAERVWLKTPTVLTRNTLHFFFLTQCDAREKERSTKDLKMRRKEHVEEEKTGFLLRSNQSNDAGTGGNIYTHDT